VLVLSDEPSRTRSPRFSTFRIVSIDRASTPEPAIQSWRRATFRRRVGTWPPDGPQYT
jgi:hypothetical protein